MDLSLTDDQTAILGAVDALTKPYAAPPLHDTGYAVTSDALDRELAEGGFLDVGFDPDLGAVSAALVVERLARLPYAVEGAVSALVRPLLGEGLARPLCLVEPGRAGRLVRFLKAGATVVVVGADGVTSFVATGDQVRAEPESLFGYPMATLLVDPATVAGETHDVAADELRARWRVALAAEAAGTLDAGDAALAALHAQESARLTVYDFHQFLGAMGMTLEHPLHLWTYRLKALAGELGGRGANALAAADAIWR